MTRTPKIESHGFWTGVFDVRALFEKPATPMYPMASPHGVCWLEARAGEGGRIVIMQRTDSGGETCLTPEDYSVRSRVHEYGGCPYTLHRDECYFVNDTDQRIYRQPLDARSGPEPVTPAPDPGEPLRYIDLCVTGDGQHLVSVMERERPASGNENMLATVRLEPGRIHPPRILQRGRDFYANPVIDPEGDRIAWVQWDHPYMPWDRSEAVTARCVRDGEDLVLDRVERVIGGPDTSVCQLGFDDDGLILAIDGGSAPGTIPNFWNLYRWRDGRFTQLTFDEAEYGAPHWVFGDRRYVILEDRILAVRTGADGDSLVEVDKHGGGGKPLQTDAVDIRQLARSGPCQALMIMATRDCSPALNGWQDGRMTTIKGVEELLPPDAVSRSQAIEFPTGDDDRAHAYFYPPRNPGYRAPEGELPPMLVMVHGGPTARSSNALDLTRQYWTGIGFAVLDVNHRGSTGYGRAYRQSLLGQWGRYDTEDVINAIRFVADRGWINRDRVFIRGRSAGGYAVLSALTRYPEVFAAGACYYGIGNLETLAQITHKFEGRYTDRLIGEDYDPERAADPQSLFRTRSPVHYVESIRCPLIVFQGLDDKIVPPDVSREIAHALEKQGLDYDYIEYAGEGHGFRSSTANIDALERETAFYRNVLAATTGTAGRGGS